MANHEAIGLGDLGRADGFLERQVDRWLQHLESYKRTYKQPGRDIPGLAYLADWLRANQPRMQRAALIHADIGFTNVLFDHAAPARVNAVIDWEIATLGDPLLDLGRAVSNLPGRYHGSGKSKFQDLSDVPTREDVAERYAELTGLDVQHLNYYCVLAAFKLACIVEFHYFRITAGLDNSDIAHSVATHVPQIVAQAEELARATR